MTLDWQQCWIKAGIWSLSRQNAIALPLVPPPLPLEHSFFKSIDQDCVWLEKWHWWDFLLLRRQLRHQREFCKVVRANTLPVATNSGVEMQIGMIESTYPEI